MFYLFIYQKNRKKLFSCQKVKENKLIKAKVYTEFNEQFQAIAWVILLLLLAEILILDRKNPLFKNIHLFSNKK